MLAISLPSPTIAQLDRPVWTALTTHHAGLAEGDGLARRLSSEIGPFAGAADETPESLAALAQLVARSRTHVALMQGPEIMIPPAIRATLTATGVQMVAEAPIVAPDPLGIVRLGPEDAPDMLALATLTKPGPFALRTLELGAYWGIRSAGRLVAMAGERMKQPGFTEISAVCVHPDQRGKGHAARLCTHAAATIQARDEIPYLHAFSDNTAAIGLYERLGFRHRRTVHVAMLEAEGAAVSP
ncbi:MAG: GNAT family N-acetyltransferase [Pseudomonadota bacterium]